MPEATGQDGRQFGPYRLIQQIASGGMAEIHLAATKGVAGFEKVVALKMIHPNFSSDDHFIQMLIDEAKISVQLQHVNIAHVFDLGKVGDTYYIAMELVDGVDLFKVLRKASEQDRHMPVEMAAFVGKEVCAGLDYAHHKRDSAGRSMGIVHRDISPQNVLLSHAGEVKLVDFGIAKASMRAKQTAVGVIKGKYYYMSPEQAWGDPVDHRTDIFSAGILVYEMLTGQMLYLEEDMNRLLEMVRKADIAPPSSKRPEVPRELDRIVMRALAKKPDLRWQTAADFGTALERFLHSHAPDFSAQKLAAFVNDIMPPAPPPARLGSPPPAPAPDAARVTKGIGRQSIVQSRSELTDENSVIFRLSDVADVDRLAEKAEPRAAAKLARAVPPSSGRASVSPNRLTTPAARPGPASAPAPAAAPAAGAGRSGAASSARGKRGGAAAAWPANRMTTPSGGPPERTLEEARSAETQVSRPTFASGSAGAASIGDATIELGDEQLLPSEDLVEELGEPTADDTKDAPPPTEARSVDATGAGTRDATDDLATATTEAGGTGPGTPPAADDATPAPAAAPAPSARPSRGQRATLPLGAPGPDDEAAPAASSAAPAAEAPVVSFRPVAPASAPAPAGSAARATGPIARVAEPEAAARNTGPVQRVAENASVPPAGRSSSRRSRRTPGHGVPLGVSARLGESGRMAALPLSPPVEDVRRETASGPAVVGVPAALARVPAGTPVWPPGGGAPEDSWAEDDFFGLALSAINWKRMLLAVLGVAALVGLGALAVAAFHNGPPTRDDATLEIISIPAGAHVLVDGTDRGPSPIKLEHLPIGKPVAVRLELERYQPWQRSEPLSEARDVKIVASLRPILGTLHVDSAPVGAEVFLDNRSLGLTPLVRADMNPFVDGTVEVRKQGHRPSRQALHWEGQREARLRFELTPAGP
jgi:serine/threonine protein kinase